MAQEQYLSNSGLYYSYNYMRWLKGQCKERHDHDFLQIIHVVDGVFEVDLGDGWREVPPGSAHVLPPHHAHAIRTTRAHLQFGLNLRPPTFRDDRGWSRLAYSRFTDPAILPVSLPEGLAEALSLPVAGQDEAARLRLLTLFDQYLLALLSAQESPGAESRRERLLAYLNDHVRTPRTVAQLAAKLEMGRSSLQRFCQSQFGCGAKALQERVRLERGARLLLETGLTVGECASRCGYGDIFAFSRSFKRSYGVSPLCYRRDAAKAL